MKNAAQKPKKESLFLRVRAWLRKRGHRSAPVQSVVMLPRQATLFSGKLMLSLPPDFRPLSSKQDSAQFFGKSSGLHLTVMQTDFSRKLHSLKSTDLQKAFRKLIPSDSVTSLKAGFLRHSQTLTAEWDGKKGAAGKKTVLHLIQVRKTVFLLLFENITPDNAVYTEPIIFAASVSV